MGIFTCHHITHLTIKGPSYFFEPAFWGSMC